MIELSGIKKRFGTAEVLGGVDLVIPEGSVTALIGPSGGGKSTLLRCVNLLELPNEGRVRIGEDSVDFDGRGTAHRSDILRLRRRTGMVFQAFNLFPHRTALRNVMEGLTTVQGWDEDKAAGRARELLDRVGLTHKASSYPAELSGGQQQRVAIARALAASPSVLLCDEPTSALDPELAAEVAAVLRDLAADGVTMLVATHDLRLAAQIARGVVFLADGAIVEEGPPRELFLSPKKERTAAFVASLTGEGPSSWTI